MICLAKVGVGGYAVSWAELSWAPLITVINFRWKCIHNTLKCYNQ